MLLPKFNREKHKKDVEREIETAKYLKMFWNTLTEKEKAEPEILTFIVQCGWLNHKKGNEILARYLGEKDSNTKFLSKAIHKKWENISENDANNLLELGITNYYTAFRPNTTKYICNNTEKMSKVFTIVSSKTNNTEDKIKRIFKVFGKEPLYIATPNGGDSSILNAITPAMACLDPNRKFPIMNQRTKKLLKTINKEQDIDGAIALSELISKGDINVRDAFELDVYAQVAILPSVQHFNFKSKVTRTKTEKFRDVGHKSEQNSHSSISKERRIITKEHNKLVNKFKKYLEWKYLTKESYFDIFIPKYKNNKSLLVEAKTSSSDGNGRMQIRVAIGQLFDYRKTHFPTEIDKIDLAVLLPKKPHQDIIDLLESLEIYTIWFNKDKLEGSIKL
ncbi:MAG: hypothetical protein WC614_00315 [bacterium]